MRRFLDQDAVILYVEPEHVIGVSEITGATPFDVDGVELSHRDGRCSFDAFLETFAIDDPAVVALANIVRGADTDQMDIAPESAGLLAVSRGWLQCTRTTWGCWRPDWWSTTRSMRIAASASARDTGARDDERPPHD